MDYEPKHMKPQVKALLIEALGPGTPQITVDEFTSIEDALQEMRDRWNNANERHDFLIKDSYINGDYACLYADNERYEWQVYEIER